MGARDDETSTVTSSWCTPVLMIYYLCCWPGDSKSDTSSENQSRRSTTATTTTTRHGHASWSSGSRRATHLPGNRIGSSAVSLHLPGTSGSKKDALAAHRSHEEIGRRKSHHELVSEEAARHHSAPSVIDEVIHRRDWDRSNRDLYIPLKPEALDDARSLSSDSPERALRAEPEATSSDGDTRDKPCKKHYKNIKSSKGKKEKQVEEDKDCDATEASSFYIGDNDAGASGSGSADRDDALARSIYKAKEAKQCFNESIRSKERPRQTLVPLDELQPRTLGFCMDDVIDRLESLDRSGATHHSIESRISLSKPAFPPPSVEPAGYEGGACYLEGWGERASRPPPLVPRAPLAVSTMRARHASDGDILAPPHRPESGAFSESDLDLEVEGSEELPPAYDELTLCAPPERRETAI